MILHAADAAVRGEFAGPFLCIVTVACDVIDTGMWRNERFFALPGNFCG
jgi:hypothetical protein